jgi:hypothetical protein
MLDPVQPHSDDATGDHQGSKFGLFVLEGAPFNRRGVPVEALFELVTYRAIIVDVAKQCFLRDNPERLRSRRNMEKDFDLRLVDINEGSSDLVLERAPVSELDRRDEPVFSDYFDQGRDLVSRAIVAVATTGAVPSDFPLKSLVKFRHLGRTLERGCRIKTGRVDGSNTAYVTTAVHDAFAEIIASMSDVSHQEVVGRIVELDTERLVFHLRTAEGTRVLCNYGWNGLSIPASLLSDESGEGPLVEVDGDALVNAEGDIQRFETVTSVTRFAIVRLKEHLVKLLELPSGWLGGVASEPVKRELVVDATGILEQLDDVPEDLAPAPLPDGGLRFEWSRNSEDFILEMNVDGSAYMCILADRAEDDRDVLLEARDMGRIRHFLEEGLIG